MRGVIVPHMKGNIADFQLAALQQGLGLFHAHLDNIFGKRNPAHRFEQAGQIRGIHKILLGGQLVKRQVTAVIALALRQNLVDNGLAGGILSRVAGGAQRFDNAQKIISQILQVMEGV